MRNLSRYPVTKQEMLDAIDAAAPSLDSDRVGDIAPVALQRVREIIEARHEGTRETMTRNERIIELLERQSEKLLAQGPEACRDYLISLGIYDDNGDLTPEYGGKS
jgi:hypothetical protein